MLSTFSNIKASNEIISTEEPLIHLIIISFGLINSRAALLFGLHRKDLIDRLDLSWSYRAVAMAFRMSSASSGMGVADDCKHTFLELKRKKVHRYVVFKIDEKTKQVVVEKTGGPAESYDDFTASLPENDCRYAVYDFDFVTYENCQKSKIFFIAWCPDLSKIRAKMLYATTKDRLKRELDGFHYEVQATDPSEIDIEVIRDRAN